MRIELIIEPNELYTIRKVLRVREKETKFLSTSDKMQQCEKDEYIQVSMTCARIGHLLDIALDEGIYTFERANGNGQSKCLRCGLIGWDCMMYKVKEIDDHRVCSSCKKILMKE